jgi:hypothetical protein
MLVFPADDISAEQVSGWLEELHIADLIRRFSHEGKDYLQVVNWEEHQTGLRQRSYRFPQLMLDGESFTVVLPQDYRRATVELREAYGRPRASSREVSGESRDKQPTTTEEVAGGDSYGRATVQQPPAPVALSTATKRKEPTKPTEDAPPHVRLAYAFYRARLKIKDFHFDPYEPKHLTLCAKVVKKKSSGDLTEIRRRLDNMAAHHKENPDFFPLLPGTLVAKWELLNDPPQGRKPSKRQSGNRQRLEELEGENDGSLVPSGD